MLCMGRPGSTDIVVARARAAGVDVDAQHARGVFVLGPELEDVSSTAVRRALRAGDAAALAPLLHPDVAAWCLRCGPYQPTSARSGGGGGGAPSARPVAAVGRSAEGRPAASRSAEDSSAGGAAAKMSPAAEGRSAEGRSKGGATAARVVVIGLTGCTRSGKSRVARALEARLGRNPRVAVVGQDAFWSRSVRVRLPSGGEWSSDEEPQCTDHAKFACAIEAAVAAGRGRGDGGGGTRRSARRDVVVVVAEGFQLLHDARVRELLSGPIVLFEVCQMKYFGRDPHPFHHDV